LCNITRPKKDIRNARDTKERPLNKKTPIDSYSKLKAKTIKNQIQHSKFNTQSWLIKGTQLASKNRGKTRDNNRFKYKRANKNTRHRNRKLYTKWVVAKEQLQEIKILNILEKVEIEKPKKEKKAKDPH